jgi:hypothetical protein
MQFSKIKNTLAHYYRTALHYLEAGDLVVFLIIISVVHFQGALAPYDNPVVSVAFGLGVDVGMYRLIKAALKYNGWWWAAALALVVMSYFYHLEYYHASPNAWVLAAPIPMLIILLAALSHKERTAEKLQKQLTRESVKQETRRTHSHSQDKNENENEKPKIRATRMNENYAKFKSAQLARNGSGPMDAETVMKTFGVSQATAYRWLERYANEIAPIAHEKASVN